MDAVQALADLTEISSQVEAAVLFDEAGAVAAATVDEAAAEAFARAARDLLERASSLAAGDVTQIEVSTPTGSVFVVRHGARRIAATTGADPTTGLVFYDLKSCLRESAAAAATEKPKRRRTTKKADDAA
jgi:predicted regulator of Ras-like GTPase activity (Roadblock/LC7/MglB family)